MTPFPRRGLVVAADLRQLALVRSWIRSHAQAAGFEEREVLELELWTTECVSNVVRHGYGGDASGQIELGAELLPDRFVLTVRDEAGTFDPTRGQGRGAGTFEAGGYGLSLVARLADEIGWRPGAKGGNELSMTRLLPQTEPTDESRDR